MSDSKLLSQLQIKYDLVVSAFSLLDILDAKNRIHVIENLWHKTQDMLVVVEHGSRAGFAAVLEARNFILQLAGHKITSSFKIDSESKQVLVDAETTDATVVSPVSKVKLIQLNNENFDRKMMACSVRTI